MKRIVGLIVAFVLLTASVTVSANDSSVSEGANVQELKLYGIMKGDPDGGMRVEDKLTRAEAVTLLVRLYGFVPETSEAAPANKFADMENHWACNAAMIAENLRISDTDGVNFHPNESVSAEGLVKMLVCLLGYKEAAEKKETGDIGYLMQASQLGITNGVAIATGQSISRGQAAKLICNSLDIPLMVMTSFSKEEESRYTIMNGKNGTEFRSLRTMIEEWTSED